jgi:hypothetical protein
MDLSQSVGRSVLAPLKPVALVAFTTLLFVLGLLLLSGIGFARSETLWIALPTVVGLADWILVPAVGSTVRPLPFGASEEDLRRISAGALRTVIMLRFALAEAAVLFGFVSSLLAQSLWPFVIGAVLAGPLLVAYVYPSQRVVRAVRERLESNGVTAPLPGTVRPAPRA